jgi:TRAP-type transport system periplasmic protein
MPTPITPTTPSGSAVCCRCGSTFCERGRSRKKGARHGVSATWNPPEGGFCRWRIRLVIHAFKSKKLRIFASDFQSVALKRLGATPVAMTLGNVLPAIQQGTIDGAFAGVSVFASMHFQDAAKYVTETNQPAIFLIVEISRKWYDSLPGDLQQIVDRDAATESLAINTLAIDLEQQARKGWVDNGGELISLPSSEQSTIMETLASVGEDVSKTKPKLRAS